VQPDSPSRRTVPRNSRSGSGFVASYKKNNKEKEIHFHGIIDDITRSIFNCNYNTEITVEKNIDFLACSKKYKKKILFLTFESIIED
jgi:AraC-like DNA-binding protein